MFKSLFKKVDAVSKSCSSFNIELALPPRSDLKYSSALNFGNSSISLIQLKDNKYGMFDEAICKTLGLDMTGEEKYNILKNIKPKDISDFIDRFYMASKTKNIDEFKMELKAVDVLLVDDIQILAGKEKTNETFFQIYNSLVNNRKQIILTSDTDTLREKENCSIDEVFRRMFKC